MPKLTSLVTKTIELNCEKDMKKYGRYSAIGFRLQAILSSAKYGITRVSEIYDVARSTVVGWIKKYAKLGVEAFEVCSGRGRKKRVSPSEQAALKEALDAEGHLWSIKKMQREVQERFGKTIGQTAAHSLLHFLGFSYITPRPRHYKQDKELQEIFKKGNSSNYITET